MSRVDSFNKRRSQIYKRWKCNHSVDLCCCALLTPIGTGQGQFRLFRKPPPLPPPLVSCFLYLWGSVIFRAKCTFQFNLLIKHICQIFKFPRVTFVTDEAAMRWTAQFTLSWAQFILPVFEVHHTAVNNQFKSFSTTSAVLLPIINLWGQWCNARHMKLHFKLH